MTTAANDSERAPMWALGDYHRFAKETVWELGPVLVEACGIRAGQRVLDVAAGTGNVAIRAAEAGAEVVASDLTPENFEAGRREAGARGVELEWVEADAEALPVRRRRVRRRHLVASARCSRPTTSGGGRAAARLPSGRDDRHDQLHARGPAARLLRASSRRYVPPPPPGALPPLLWGSEEHVRELFGDRVSTSS